MTRRLALAIGLVVLIVAVAFAIEIDVVTARPTVESDPFCGTQNCVCGDTAISLNMHAIDEGPCNLTYPRSSWFRPKLPIDYSNGLPDFSGAPSDTTGTPEIPVVPEFPSFLVVILFMGMSLIGVTLSRMRVQRSPAIYKTYRLEN